MARIILFILLASFVAVGSVQASTFGEALNSPALTFTTGGNSIWFIETTDTHDGAMAMQSGIIGNSQSTWLQTQITGPGTLSFWWKVSSYTGDVMKVSLDGAPLKSITGTGGTWVQYAIVIPSGTHTIKWEYVKDSNTYSGTDCAWLDQVTFASGPEITFGDALNSPGLTFTTGGNSNWFIETVDTYDSVAAVQSGVIDDSQTTWLQTQITGPGTLSSGGRFPPTPATS